MLTPARHLVQQRNMLLSLGNVALGSLFERLRPPRQGESSLPGPEVWELVKAPSQELIEDFLRHVHASSAAYAGVVPPPLFPQWGLAVALRTLSGRGFPLVRLLNGGCRLQSNAALRRAEPLMVRARLESVTDDGRRAVLRQRIVTEQEGAPDALVAEVYGIIPNSKTRGPRNAKPALELPTEAQKIEDWALPRDAGLKFALLTGDFNPLHWLRPYARAMGFPGPILHGFDAMARAHAGLERVVAPRTLRVLDLRFVRPIVLPTQLSLFIQGERVFVGRVGEPPYLSGSFE
jgi:hypothetical protein